MNQSFKESLKNRFLRYFYILRMNPDALIVFTLGPIDLYILHVTHSFIFLLAFMLYLVFLLIWELTCMRRIKGSCCFVTRRLPFSQYRQIFQKADRTVLSKLSCSKMFAQIIHQQDWLVDALPAGRYRTVTHEVIMERIQASSDVMMLRCESAYKNTLAEIQKKLLNGRCKNCDRLPRCLILNQGKQLRQFFYIEFEKK